jgi:hypothetical protein
MEMRKGNRVLTANPEVKRIVWRIRLKREGNVKVYFREMGTEINCLFIGPNGGFS